MIKIPELKKQIEAKKRRADYLKSVCECKDEWLVDVRLNLVKCKKCGREF